MKRYLSIIATLLISFNAFAYDIKVDNIYYHINYADKTASVASMTKTIETTSNLSNKNASAYSGNIIIPSTFEYNGDTYNVTSIGRGAFNNCKELTLVSIPEGVKYIDSYAFYYCTGLKTVSLPTTLQQIGYQSFYYCNSLSSIKIPDNVTKICNEAFYACTSLLDITVPATLSEIGRQAFHRTEYLNQATATNGVKYVGNVAYSYSGSNTTITFKNGTLGIADFMFDSNTTITAVTIPSSCIVIGEGAFYNCTSLKTVTFDGASKLTTIKRLAFADCKALNTMDIPSSVYKVGEQAFDQTKWLRNQEPYDNVIYAGKAAILSATNVENITLKEGTLGINSDLYCYRYNDNYHGTAFAYIHDSKIKSITIPSSVVFVDNNGAVNARAEEFHISENMKIEDLSCLGTFVDQSGFYLGGNLKYITVDERNPYYAAENGILYSKDFTKLLGIPNNYEHKSEELRIKNTVKTICFAALPSTNGLSSIVIPASVGKLEVQAFFNIPAGISITSYAQVPPSAFNNYICNLGNTTLYVPEKSIEAYRNKYPWSEAKEILPIPTPVKKMNTSIGDDWTSTNKGMDSSISDTTYNFTCGNNTKFTFDWIVSSEPNYDIFSASLDGETILIRSGESSGQFETTLSAGEHTLSMQYTKDESQDHYEDYASVTNLQLTTLYAELKDGETFDNYAEELCSNISYERTFDNTEWQAFFVPFDIPMDTLKNDFKVASVNDVVHFDDNDDGVIEEIEISASLIEDDIVYANTPYLIKALTAGAKKITVENSILHSIDNITHECSSLLTKYLFHGNYESISSAIMNSNGYYAVGNNKTLTKQHSSNLLPYRWYMDIKQLRGDAVKPEIMKIRIAGEDEPVKTGDVNDDGNINIVDVSTVVSILLKSEYSKVADVNNDGKINVVDVSTIVNIILNQ